MSTDVVLKILTLGESSVGKTSIILRYTENTFSEQFLTTIGIDFKQKIIDFHNKKIKVLLVDTSGQVRFRNIAANYFKSADGILFVYDVTKKDTLTKFEYWFSQIQEQSNVNKNSIVIFGNKNDCEEQREVSQEEARTIGNKYGMVSMEGSAQSGEGIQEAIEKIIENILSTRSFLDEESINTALKLKTDKTFQKMAEKMKEEEYKKKTGCC